MKVLITGASSGIGKSVSDLLRESGWEIVAPSHAELDLGDLEAVAAYGDQLKRQPGRYDAFIHLAGIWHDDHAVLAGKSVDAFAGAQIAETMNVGVTSAMILVAALAPGMDGGTVIGVSGTFESGGAGWLPYYTSKRALEDFLAGLSQDMPSLKVYGVSPSDTATEAYAKFYPQFICDSQSPESVASLIAQLLVPGHQYASGDIIVIKQGKPHTAFHA